MLYPNALQQIVSLSRKADPQRLRTIQVLTKADRIEEGNHHLWESMLLRPSTFVVVNPNPQDLLDGISEKEAADKERGFFVEHEFFSSDHLASAQGRFGVAALQAELSRRLVKLFKEEVPMMKKALMQQLKKVRNRVVEVSLARVHNLLGTLDESDSSKAWHRSAYRLFFQQNP